MSDLKSKRAFARWVVAGTMLAPVLLYHAFFWSFEHPPWSPPFGGDGDWAKLYYILGLPFLLGFVVVGGLGAYLIFRVPSSDSADQGRG